MLGQVYLEKYKARALLGEGGMCQVLLGNQLNLQREVAIKVLLPSLLKNEKAVGHFRREIHIHSRFQHPNAVTYLDGDAELVTPVLIMECVHGKDLYAVLMKEGALSEVRTGHLLGQLCQVIQGAHDAGIVHRDVKPSNILIASPGTLMEKVKLMDFGLAKMASLFYSAKVELISIENSTASGTPEYISPEQARGNDVDHRSDIYSLGIMLFEMLTGHRPFEGSMEELLLAHADRQPPSFGQVGTKVLPAIEDLVMQCLAKYPEERPSSAEEVARRYEMAIGKQIYSPNESTSRIEAKPTGVSTPRSKSLRASGGMIHPRNAYVQRIQATMPESMAMLKLKGFIHDLGGQIVDTQPGTIHVHIGGQRGESTGVLGWLTGKKGRSGTEGLRMELHLEALDLSRPSDLTITMTVRGSKDSLTTNGKARCEMIVRDLQAYMMGR